MAVRLKDRIEANIRQSDKVNSSLSINGKSYNGSQAITVGTLGAEYGGTGETSLINASNALLNALTTGSSVPQDGDYYISQYVGGGTTTTTFHRRPMSALLTYVKNKTTVSNTITGGTTAGPTISTTVNGITGTAVTIPSASTTSAGVVTTSSQRFRGTKTLEYPIISSNNSRYQGFYYRNGAGVAVGDHWLDVGDVTNITAARFYWRQYSPNSTANAATTGFYEQYYLPFCTTGLTANVSYEILTSKSYSTLDSRYLKLSGGTLSGSIVISHATTNVMDSTTTNPRIVFSENGQQAVGLVYTDYDTYRSPAGLKVVDMSGSNGDPWFEVPGAIYAGGGKVVLHAGNCNSYVVGLSGNQTVAGTKTFTGSIIISKSTTIAANTPAQLQFSVTQTDNNVTSKGYIACYDDLDANGYGVNMVINTTSGLYLSAGEGAGSYLSSNPSTGENVHICADSQIYFHANCNTVTNATTTCYISTAGVLYGACWNDYAEYRSQNEPLIAGHITYCDDDGKLKYTTERLQKFEGVVSDTFGFAIGETDECKTPLAVSGRVLVYCDPEDHFHSGDCVCAGPNGKAYRMTREEIAMYPDRIVGVVSEIPTYERWGSGNVEVNGRIWIKVK